MLSKCANPGCMASFRYLHSGKLYRFEARQKGDGAEAEHKLSNSVEFFWLCEDCAANYTLTSDPVRGTCVVPLPKRVLRAAS